MCQHFIGRVISRYLNSIKILQSCPFPLQIEPKTCSHHCDNPRKQIDASPPQIIYPVINWCIAPLPQDGPVVLVAVFDIGIDGHPLGSHPLDISWACVIQHLLRGGFGVDGLYVIDESVQNWLIFSTTDHPISSLVDPLVQSGDLFLAKVGFFTVEHLEVVPIWHLDIEIQINSTVLLHHKQP